MTPYCIQTGDITNEDQAICSRIRDLVDSMEDNLTCHEVCERISRMEDLAEKVNYVRGWFGQRGIQHSWLTLKERPKILIDPYPWASTSGPLLITTEGFFNPWRKIYIDEQQTKRDDTSIYP